MPQRLSPPRLSPSRPPPPTHPHARDRTPLPPPTNAWTAQYLLASFHGDTDGLLTLPKPDRLALPNLATVYAIVINSKVAKAHATPEDPWANQWLTKNLATTGPYYIASRTLGQQLELKAVPNHWSGKQPAFEEVILRITGNADLVSLIKGGVVDYAAEGLTGRQYDALAASGFPVLHGETPSILRVSID